MRCCIFAAECRQSKFGQQYRAVRECGEGRIGDSVTANANKPISSLSDAGEPFARLCGNAVGERHTGSHAATEFSVRPPGGQGQRDSNRLAP